MTKGTELTDGGTILPDDELIVIRGGGNARVILGVEGTFTPTVIFAGGSGTTYSEQQGNYIRVGNMITFWGRVVLTSKGSASGAVKLGGLPIACASRHHAITVGYANGCSITAGESITGYVSSGTTEIVLVLWEPVSGTAALDASEVTNTFNLIYSGSYRI